MGFFSITCFVIRLFSLISRDYPKRGKGRDENKRDPTTAPDFDKHWHSKLYFKAAELPCPSYHITNQKSMASIFESSP